MRSAFASGSGGQPASVLHYYAVMETVVLGAALMLSGLLAAGGTRAVLGVVLLAIMRNASR